MATKGVNLSDEIIKVLEDKGPREVSQLKNDLMNAGISFTEEEFFERLKATLICVERIRIDDIEITEYGLVIKTIGVRKY